MDHRLIAAFAAIISIMSVFGAVSLMSDESDGALYPDSETYVKGTVLDFTSVSEYRITIPVRGATCFYVEIPVILPGGINLSTNPKDETSSFDSYFHPNFLFSDDVLYVFGSVNGLNKEGYCCLTAGSDAYKLWISFDSSGAPLEDNGDYQILTSQRVRPGWGFVEGQSFTFDFPHPCEYDYFAPLKVGSVPIVEDFFTLSEDGNSISGTAPLRADLSRTTVIYFFGFDDSFYGDIVSFHIGVSSYDVIPVSSSFELVVNEEFESFQILDTEPFVDVDWVCTLPEGISEGISSNSWRSGEFWVYGTPVVVGSYDVVISGADTYTGLEFEPVTVTITVLDKYSVVFHGEDGSELLNLDVVQGRLVDILPVEPVKEGMVFAGWFTDPELTNPFDPRSDYPASDLDLYPGFSEPALEPEPEPPVSDGVVSVDTSDDGMDVPLGLLIILGLVVVVGLMAVAGGRRR